MEISLKQQKPPGALAEQRASNKLVKLIRKLRWMGLEGEAQRVQVALCSGTPAADVGTVNAPDAEAAIKAAIEKYNKNLSRNSTVPAPITQAAAPAPGLEQKCPKRVKTAQT